MQLNGYIIEHQSDLSGANLSGLEIVNADITQATLAGANLAGSKIVNVQSRGASFERSNLVKADLVGEDLEGVDFSHADLTDADLSEANLRGANFIRAKLVRTKFRHANLAGAALDYCEIKHADFSDAEFHGHVELSEQQLLQRGVRSTRKGEWYDFLPSSGHTEAKNKWARDLDEDRRWSGNVTFHHAIIRGCKFVGANFGCDCSDKLQDTNDEGISCGIEAIPSFLRCDFSKSNLQQIDVGYMYSGDRFHYANMEETTIRLSSKHDLFVGARINRARSKNSKPLLGANLRNATISGFYITSDKKFSNGYRLSGANISGATFKDSYVLEIDQNGYILKRTLLSDFSESKIKQFLAC